MRLEVCRCVLAVLLLHGASGAWAQSAPPPPEPSPTEAAPDPTSPMVELPDIGVEWPDMAETSADAPDQSLTAEVDGERRYTVVVEGAEKLSAIPFRQRFNDLSTLKAGEGKPANTAQIDRRIREDQTLIEEILKTSGFYDALVDAEVETGAAGALLVRFTVVPGPLYRFESVSVDGLAKAGEQAPKFEAAFGVSTDDAADADDVVAGVKALETQLQDGGFPFAKVNEPEVVVDHDRRSATLAMTVDPGGKRRFGALKIVSPDPPFSDKHLGRIARFKTGEDFDRTMMEDLRRALVATGIVGDVDVVPVPAGEDKADVNVSLSPAPKRTISAELGYGTGEGVRIEGNWTHRNFFRPEGALTLRGVVGTQEQLAGVIIRQSNFKKRDHALNARLIASNLNRRAFDAYTVEIGANIERQSNILWQKRWTWSAGAEFIASDERDMTRGLVAGRKTFLIAAAPFTLGYDRSNDLLDPTTGFRIGLRVAPEVSLKNGTNPYVRTQLDASAYVPASKSVVVAGRVRFGSIFGATTFSLPPSRRFYSGGGGSVRGYGYQLIGPRDGFNDPVGGRSLAEFALEARVRIGDFGVVPFVDGGSIYDSRIPKLSDFRFGAGIGARYYSSFGPIRLDVATPINPRPGDPRVTLFVSLGQAF
jgi:translocation and assembly module TamA